MFHYVRLTKMAHAPLFSTGMADEYYIQRPFISRNAAWVGPLPRSTPARGCVSGLQSAKEMSSSPPSPTRDDYRSA